MVVGVIVALAFVRMTRERFLPLEENPVSRGIARVYVADRCAGFWLTRRPFSSLPVTILFAGLTIWLGIGTRRSRRWVGPSTCSPASKPRPS